jgi:hypothetical protein
MDNDLYSEDKISSLVRGIDDQELHVHFQAPDSSRAEIISNSSSEAWIPYLLLPIENNTIFGGVFHCRSHCHGSCSLCYPVYKILLSLLLL